MKKLFDYLNEAGYAASNAGSERKINYTAFFNDICPKTYIDKMLKKYNLDPKDNWSTWDDKPDKAGARWDYNDYNNEGVKTYVFKMTVDEIIDRFKVPKATANLWRRADYDNYILEDNGPIGVRISPNMYGERLFFMFVIDLTDKSIAKKLDEYVRKQEETWAADSFTFTKEHTPGGIYDAAGREMMVGDIVAIMRRTGTGGMILGKVISLKKRPNILTEYDANVSLDGTQCCIVQRGNTIVK